MARLMRLIYRARNLGDRVKPGRGSFRLGQSLDTHNGSDNQNKAEQSKGSVVREEDTIEMTQADNAAG